jgi:hypothetical protein
LKSSAAFRAPLKNRSTAEAAAQYLGQGIDEHPIAYSDVARAGMRFKRQLDGSKLR